MLLKSEAEKDLSNPTSSSERPRTQPHGAREMTPPSVLEILVAGLCYLPSLSVPLVSSPQHWVVSEKEGYRIVMQGLNYVKQTVLERERWGLLRCRRLHMS